MKVKREDLLVDLNMVRGGLSPREYIEQSSCFVFDDGEVMTFNDEVACRKEIFGNDDGPIRITGAVQAASLLAILEAIPDEYLAVREHNGELEFRGKRKGFGLTKEDEIFLPISKVEKPTKWKSLPKDFTRALDTIQHCVSTDESKFRLTCVNITPTHLEACDNRQLMRFELPIDIGEPFLIRGTSLAQVAPLNMEKYSISQTWAHFRNADGLMLSCRRYIEDYPDIKAWMDVKGTRITLSKGLKEAGERAAIFAVNKSGDATLNISSNGGDLKIRGVGQTGWYQEYKQIKYQGPPLNFYISPTVLSYIADTYQKAVVNEARFKAAGDSWEYVAALAPHQDEKPEDEEEDEEAKAVED